MIKDIHKILKALVSDVALQEAYEHRRRNVLHRNNRTLFTVAIVSGILIGILAFITGMIFIDRDSQSYLKSRNRITLLNGLNQTWKFGQIDGCVGKNSDCKPFQLSSVDSIAEMPLSKIIEQDFQSPNTKYIRLKFTIPKDSWQSLSTYLTLVISLPNMTYSEAIMYLNGAQERKFFLSRPLYFPFITEGLAGTDLAVDVLLKVIPSEPFKIGLASPSFISTQKEYEKFNEFEILKSSGRGDWIALVSRLTLALFAIGLFLLIDSSSESLGLALFMGFEALGIAAKQGWLPLSWLGPLWDLFTASFFNNLGLVFRLYFYFNLARMGGVSLPRWVSLAAIWAVPMAYYAMNSANKPDSLYPMVFNIALLATAATGLVACTRSFLFIRKQDLRWRRMALFSGAIASIPAIILSLDSIFPYLLVDSRLIDTLKNFHFNSGFLLALSAFFNISTLENRVRALTAVQTKAKQLEMELELGRSVQKQQMTIPKVPDDLKVDFFQSAASYVSGDTFFLHWDENNKIFTALLNDVTGHGVHAALKATVCNVMADLVWAKGKTSTESSDKNSKIAIYNHLVCNYLRDRFQTNDLHSICGAEFLLDEGRVQFYRSNAPFPIILQPNATADDSNQKFSVLNLALLNEELTTIELKAGAVVILLSDGITFSSREHAHIIRQLKEMIHQSSSGDIDLQLVKETITTFTAASGKHIDDDKTIVLFQWKPHSTVQRIRKSA